MGVGLGKPVIELSFIILSYLFILHIYFINKYICIYDNVYILSHKLCILSPNGGSKIYIVVVTFFPICIFASTLIMYMLIDQLIYTFACIVKRRHGKNRFDHPKTHRDLFSFLSNEIDSVLLAKSNEF